MILTDHCGTSSAECLPCFRISLVGLRCCFDVAHRAGVSDVANTIHDIAAFRIASVTVAIPDIRAFRPDLGNKCWLSSTISKLVVYCLQSVLTSSLQDHVNMICFSSLERSSQRAAHYAPLPNLVGHAVCGACLAIDPPRGLQVAPNQLQAHFLVLNPKVISRAGAA
jgi:hypothetical protein